MGQNWNSVIFIDLDNTLIEGPFETAVFPVVLKELSEKTGLELSLIRKQVVEENFERQKRSDISAVLAMDWDDIFNSVAKKLGVSLDSNAIEIVKSHNTPPDSVILDDANKILQQISKPTRAIVGATKGLRKYQIPILEGLGLLQYFTELITPDTNNALKQNISFYGDWVKTNIRISVGDHYLDDVVSPKSFGFKAIWKVNKQIDAIQNFTPFERINHYTFQEHQNARPDAIIISLTELPSVIEQIERESS